MDSSIAFQAVAILILIALSSFFSSAETAMTTVNKIRIQSGLRHLREIKITINRRNAGFFMSNFIYFYVVRSCILSLYVI